MKFSFKNLALTLPVALLITLSYQPSATSADITSLTLNITGGSLTISAPASFDLGSAGSPSAFSVQMTPVTVTDNRGIVSGGSWIASVIASALTPTAGPAIPAALMSYGPGAFTKTGTVVLTEFVVTTLEGVIPVVTATGVAGNNSATWSPTFSIAIPSGFAVGTYTGTITHSVL